MVLETCKFIHTDHIHKLTTKRSHNLADFTFNLLKYVKQINANKQINLTDTNFATFTNFKQNDTTDYDDWIMNQGQRVSQ